MPTLHRYTKHIDSTRTVALRMPDEADPLGTAPQCTELAEKDGVTYVSVPDGLTLPLQPSEITVERIELTPALRREIMAASPHVRLIHERVRARIAAQYSASDEIGLLRTALFKANASDDEHKAYDQHVEDCVAWGRAEKAKLGL